MPLNVTFPARGVEEHAGNHDGLPICLLFTEMDKCKCGEGMLFLCHIPSSLFSTCQMISKVWVEKGDIFCFHVAPEELLSLLKSFNCFGWFVLSLRSFDIPYLCQSEYKTQFKSAGLLNSPILEFLPAISLPLLAFNSRLMSQHLIPALIKRCLSGLKPFKYVSPNTDLSQEQC